MSPLKKFGFFAATIFLMFFAACGGDSSTPTPTPPAASISITAQTVKAYVGGSATISVTAQNTDFTVEANPSGSGCIKNNNNVVCTPTASGTYTVTVTATADTSKKVSATVTVPELEILAGDKQTLYADETDGAVIEFNAAGSWTAAAAGSEGGDPAWLSLSASKSGLSVNDSMLQMYGDDDYREMAASVSGSSGNIALKVTLQPNDSGADRTATITITTSKGEIKVTITQRYTKKDGTPYKKPDVTIAISPLTENTTVGISRTFTVAAQNTDFALSAPSGSGCVKSGDNAVVCTPTTAGTYAFMVTATADATKYASATLTVTDTGQKYHTVIFNVDGNTTATLQVAQNSSLGSNMPSSPIKSGYDFLGWNTSSSAASGSFTSETLVTSDITVYAIWDETSSLSIKRFQAIPNVDIGREKIKYSFRYGKYDFYYIYLGQLRNIPMFYAPAAHYSGIGFRYTFSKTDTETESIKTAVTNNSSEAINIVNSTTVSASVGGKLATELSVKVGVKGIAYAETALKIAAEESWNKLISDESSGGIERTNSLTETVEYLTTNTLSMLQEFEHNFTSADNFGYYRWTMFLPSDVYLYVIKNNTPGVKEVFYEFREHVISKPDYFWEFDYVNNEDFEKNGFGQNNDTSFEFDSSLLEDLPVPGLDIYDVAHYTIVYNNDGGIGTMQPSEHVYGIEQKLRKNTFTHATAGVDPFKINYVFKGWAKSPSNTTAEFTDEASVKDLTDVNGATITLYAVWEGIEPVIGNTYTTSWQTIRGSDSEFVVTEEDNLDKQPRDTVYFFKSFGVDLGVMRANGYNYIDFNISLSAIKVNNGEREVHLLKANVTKPVVLRTFKFDDLSATEWKNVNITFLNVMAENFTDGHFTISYGANGSQADTWKNRNLQIQLVFKK